MNSWGAREPRGRDYPFHRHRRIGERDVVPHGALEQQVFLEDHTHLTAEPGRIRHCQVDAVHQHLAARGDVQSLEQSGQGALSRSRASHDADHLTGADVQSHVPQHLGSIRPVTECHPLEPYPPPHARERGTSCR